MTGAFKASPFGSIVIFVCDISKIACALVSAIISHFRLKLLFERYFAQPGTNLYERVLKDRAFLVPTFYRSYLSAGFIPLLVRIKKNGWVQLHHYLLQICTAEKLKISPDHPSVFIISEPRFANGRDSLKPSQRKLGAKNCNLTAIKRSKHKTDGNSKFHRIENLVEKLTMPIFLLFDLDRNRKVPSVYRFCKAIDQTIIEKEGKKSSPSKEFGQFILVSLTRNNRISTPKHPGFFTR